MMSRVLGRRGLAGVLAWAASVIASLGCGLPRDALFAAPTPKAVTIDGTSVIRFPVAAQLLGAALYVPAPYGRPTLVHFHGNGQQLADLGPLVSWLRDERVGVFAVEYPGYGLNAGQSPSETSLFAVAEAALDHLERKLGVAVKDVVLMGQSLGTGVATEMALRGRGSAVVLISPYTSIDALGAHWLPGIPSSLVVDDHFDNLAKAPRVRAPVLIVTGLHDPLIPPSMSEELAASFPHATLLWVRTGHHNDLFALGRRRALVAAVAEFAVLATGSR